MRIIILIFIFAFVSCNQKQESLNSDSGINKPLKDEDNNSEKKNTVQNFVLNKVYNEDDYEFTDLLINYGIDKFIIDNDSNEFIIDSTLDNEIKYQTLKDYGLDQYSDNSSIIRISNYVFSLQKNKGLLYIGLFRRVEKNNWECIDIKELEKYSDTGEYNYILGNNKVFSYSCETEKGHSCYAIVIDKVNSKGKYDKILKAIKFDLPNKKIIEIDLKKEKIKCEPEGGDD